MTDSDLQQKRIIAAAIDIGIAIAIGVGFGILAAVIGSVGAMATRGEGAGGTVVGILGRVLGFVGALIGLGYNLGRDVIFGGSSLGKKLQGIRVVTTSGHAITATDSAKRNLIFAIGSILGLFSATLGLIPCIGDMANCLLLPLMILGHLVSVGAAIYECVMIMQKPEGNRFGDDFAGTRVVR